MLFVCGQPAGAAMAGPRMDSKQAQQWQAPATPPCGITLHYATACSHSPGGTVLPPLLSCLGSCPSGCLADHQPRTHMQHATCNLQLLGLKVQRLRAHNAAACLLSIMSCRPPAWHTPCCWCPPHPSSTSGWHCCCGTQYQQGRWPAHWQPWQVTTQQRCHTE